jgi:hypothetical protein
VLESSVPHSGVLCKAIVVIFKSFKSVASTSLEGFVVCFCHSSSRTSCAIAFETSLSHTAHFGFCRSDVCVTSHHPSIHCCRLLQRCMPSMLLQTRSAATVVARKGLPTLPARHACHPSSITGPAKKGFGCKSVPESLGLVLQDWLADFPHRHLRDDHKPLVTKIAGILVLPTGKLASQSW